jgi:hypothetical protein
MQPPRGLGRELLERAVVRHVVPLALAPSVLTLSDAMTWRDVAEKIVSRR